LIYEFDLKFNASKSHALLFNSREYCYPLQQLFLCDNPIVFVDSAVHLGHYIGKDALKKNLEKIARDINVRVNSLCTNYQFVPVDIISVLFTSYCSSFYAFQFIDLSAGGFQAIPRYCLEEVCS
jgi:hypothetical protein